VSRQLWTGEGPVLADTSAWVAARGHPEARERFLVAVERGDVAWCWPVRYELTVDAANAEAIATVDRSLEALREIAVDRAVQRGVLAAMRALARGGSHGAHRLPLADLTVAVAAQQSGLDVLHFDGHFDRLAEALGIGALWVAEPQR
jgi:predicted nucleic acid-binding protein